MKTVQIPGVPFAVSQICMGCAPHGTSIPTPAAHEILDYYYANGGFFFNTAHEYGDGLSEKCLGEWVASRGVRDKVIITTKGGEDGNADGAPGQDHPQVGQHICLVDGVELEIEAQPKGGEEGDTDGQHIHGRDDERLLIQAHAGASFFMYHRNSSLISDFIIIYP